MGRSRKNGGHLTRPASRVTQKIFKKLPFKLGHICPLSRALWTENGGTLANIGVTWPKIEGTFGADGAAIALSATPLYQSLETH